MRVFPIGFALIVVAALSAERGAQAQTYCAVYETGTQSCGIPTLQACYQSLSGMGGSCVPDQSAQVPDNLIQRMERRRMEQLGPPPSPQDQQPGGLNWMPPPPGQ